MTAAARPLRADALRNRQRVLEVAQEVLATEGIGVPIDEIARHIKTTRDNTFIEQDAQGRTVNRCESIAWNGGCTDTNEFNYLVIKTMRSLGVCYLENQARV